MVSDPGNNARATDCHCPPGYTGTIWTGCARAGLRAPTYAPIPSPADGAFSSGSYVEQANRFHQRCLPGATYEQAHDFCHLLNARLCTHVEMQSLVGTISQLGAARVHEQKFSDLRCDDGTGFWTSSECPGSADETWAYYAVLSPSGGTFARKCGPVRATDPTASDKRVATCCYDSQDTSGAETGFYFDVDKVAPGLLKSGVFARVDGGQR
jgi:hypothetical protein